MARHAYEITVKGSFGQAAREAFPDMEVRTESSIMILSGALDQPSLQAVLERLRALGLELLDVRRSGLSPPD
jgi:hypothetical protein